MLALTGRISSASWQALGTSVVLKLTDPSALAHGRELVEAQLGEVDRACSRFRADSELTLVNARAGGAPVGVSATLIDAVEVGLRAAELTDGDVDPALGEALVIAGYDRDYELLERPACERCDVTPCYPRAPRALARLSAGWRTISVDRKRSTIRVGRGVRLDLGATAKALAADRACEAVYEATGSSVLVSLGGDIALAGPPPPGGWRVFVTDDHRNNLDADGQVISIVSGGLATSSTSARRWVHGEQTMHHIIDPDTGAPVGSTWRTVSVAAATCVDANIASTAALIRGHTCLAWLADCGLPARLVAHDGRVDTLGGWPAEPEHQPGSPVGLEPHNEVLAR